jgi:hypothetical protein
MLYEVRVLDIKHNLKKIISAQQLSRRHWSEFEKQQKSFSKPRNIKAANSVE